MTTNGFAQAAEALHQGEIDFESFAKSTVETRRAWVARVRRKLEPIPVWYSEEDSEQDYLLTLYERMARFDPEMSKAGDYCHFGLKMVVREIQSARGVEKHRRKGPARFERTFTALGIESLPEESSDRDPESESIRAEYYAILKGLCETRSQLAAVCALESSGGNLRAAAAHLYSDHDLRLACRLDSEKEARRAITRAVKDLAATYGKDQAQ